MYVLESISAACEAASWYTHSFTATTHLRACGPNAHLYPPRRKFGHEFRQPSFVGGQPAPSIDLAAEEEAALQAAILASLEG